MRDAPRDRSRTAAALGCAMLVACLAFWLYRSTMLPGVDLGDTPSFQTMGGSPVISARDAYPLYLALAAPLVWLDPDHPAHAMNLASVIEAAIACGLTVLVGFELSGSLAAGVIAAIFLGSSYTFWSQSVTTEVYALHITFIALVLLTLWRWQRRPTLARLAAFFLTYAFGFGNHLSMVVLLPGLVLFLLVVAPDGVRGLFRLRIVVLALICAAAGALPYLWTVRTMLGEAAPPSGLTDVFRWFWFEVTKADWREGMMLQVPRSMASARLQMFLFDLRQQFGVLPVIVAAAGVAVIGRQSPSRLGLLAIWMASTSLFALSYSVGDTHVFLLPLHFVIALLIAPGIVGVTGVARRFVGSTGGRAVPAVMLLLAADRAYQEYPALDRSADRRAEQSLAALTAGLDDRRFILLTDLNWQLQNGLNYYSDHVRRDVAVARLADVLPYAAVLIRDNQAIGRDTVLSALARTELIASYGPLVSVTPLAAPAAVPDRIAHARRGDRYVLCWLKPTPEVSFDRAELDRSIDYLTGGRLREAPRGDFMTIAGSVGEPPDLVAAADTPFRRQLTLNGAQVTIRMDAWFPFDTIRRMGFGHVIANRHHSLIIERGLSFVVLDDEGQATQTEYAAGLFEPQATFRVQP